MYDKDDRLFGTHIREAYHTLKDWIQPTKMYNSEQLELWTQRKESIRKTFGDDVIFSCTCGQNWYRPQGSYICSGWGEGAYPCECSPKISVFCVL